MCVTFFTICQFIILKHSLFDIVGKVFKFFVIVEFFLLFWIYYSKRVKFILPIAILGLLMSLFLFLRKYWHDIGLTPAAACTKCNLACIEPNTDFGLLFSSMNAKKNYMNKPI